MKTLQLRDGLSIRALEFAILHANRSSSEVRLATWKEIDFEKKLLIILDKRMKADVNIVCF
ncbi:hypothetical protein [Gilliamella apicola]|uniref:hypothetical protein n=1 Tax=Gilliamella apicola TaxID=1196095 RepID=UPI00117B101D|nr:hypothetical protein [Gilliamella apicola]